MENKAKRAAAVAALVGTSFGIGGMVAGPQLATAADSTTTTAAANTTTDANGAQAKSPGQWIKDALAPLVKDGTISQSQSDKVASTLEKARPEHGVPGGMRGGPRVEFPAAAKAIGISEDELKTALKADNATLASVAKSKNVDPQKVIDAIVAAQNTQLDKDVTDGKLTADQAAKMKANSVEHVTKMVNEGRPKGGHPGSNDSRQGPPADAPQDGAQSQSSTTAATPSA